MQAEQRGHRCFHTTLSPPAISRAGATKSNRRPVYSSVAPAGELKTGERGGSSSSRLWQVRLSAGTGPSQQESQTTQLQQQSLLIGLSLHLQIKAFQMPATSCVGVTSAHKGSGGPNPTLPGQHHRERLSQELRVQGGFLVSMGTCSLALVLLGGGREGGEPQFFSPGACPVQSAQQMPCRVMGKHCQHT